LRVESLEQRTMLSAAPSSAWTFVSSPRPAIIAILSAERGGATSNPGIAGGQAIIVVTKGLLPAV
jgi:hypothetical protein